MISDFLIGCLIIAAIFLVGGVLIWAGSKPTDISAYLTGLLFIMTGIILAFLGIGVNDILKRIGQ